MVGLAPLVPRDGESPHKPYSKVHETRGTRDNGVRFIFFCDDESTHTHDQPRS